MARRGGDEDNGDSGKDEVSRTLHELSNTLHALALRAFALDATALPPDARTHVQAVRRLAEQTSGIVSRLRALGEDRPARPRPSRLTRNRNPR